MSEPVILGNGDAAAEAADKPAEQETAPPITSECGFLVYLDDNGHWIADTNINREIIVGRSANGHDMWVAAETIAHDITSLEISQRVMMMQAAAADRAMRQMQTQQLVNQLDLTNLKTPGK